MKYNVFISIFVSLIVSLIAVAALSPKESSHQNTAFERVQKTQTLKCSYGSLSPFITVDPSTKELSGLFYDVVEEIGRRLNISIEWTEEVGYGQISAGFQAGRYDAFCGVLWATPARAAAMSFSTPIYYNRVNPCVRGDTTEYDNSSDPLNSPDKIIIGYDGDISMQLARTVFPKAKKLAMPENMPFGEAMQYITTGKADALATCDQIVVDDLNRASPGALKIAAPGKPITHTQVVLALPSGDVPLKNMVDVAIFDLREDGMLRRLMEKHLGAERVGDTTIIPSVSK